MEYIRLFLELLGCYVAASFIVGFAMSFISRVKERRKEKRR